jgi:hypothetical protein
MFRRRRTQSAADPPGHSTHAVSRLQPVEDVYLLFLNRPLTTSPVGDGGGDRRAGRLPLPPRAAPTRRPAPVRPGYPPPRPTPGALVFLSDLTAELASEGLSWSQVGIDYEAVTDRLVALHRRGEVWALRLAQLSDLAVTLLGSGPDTQIYVAAPKGGPPVLFDRSIFQARREELRAMIRADLEQRVATGRH